MVFLYIHMLVTTKWAYFHLHTKNVKTHVTFLHVAMVTRISKITQRKMSIQTSQVFILANQCWKITRKHMTKNLKIFFLINFQHWSINLYNMYWPKNFVSLFYFRQQYEWKWLLIYKKILCLKVSTLQTNLFKYKPKL